MNNFKGLFENKEHEYNKFPQKGLEDIYYSYIIIEDYINNFEKYVNMVDPNYIYGYSGDLFFVVISSLLLALLISIMTEIIARRKPVRIGSEEIELNEKRMSNSVVHPFLYLAGMLFLVFSY